jgi:hypothetical protein
LCGRNIFKSIKVREKKSNLKNKRYAYIIMESLLANKNAILEIKKKVEGKDVSMSNHIAIPNIPITAETITIVMTASNRSRQTYFTLQTIQNSSYKAIQVILVDDSDVDPIIKEELEKYPFYIDFININQENKNWVNPVVNYNIGFGYILGSKVIIQNAEVCHVGDVLGYMGSQMISDNYYICDVIAVKSSAENDIIYMSDISTTYIYKNESLFSQWYQGRERIVNYHFLSGMTIDTFNKIKLFSYDYTMGFAYDDDDFLLKIISNNINIINLFNDIYNFGGIHLWHSSNIKKMRGKIESNQNIFNKKKIYYSKTSKYIDIIEQNTDNTIIPDIINIKILPNLNLLKLQNLFIKFTNEKILNFYINKKNITPAINTFRKCILKGYLYKNSGIKIPKNIKANFFYT